MKLTDTNRIVFKAAGETMLDRAHDFNFAGKLRDFAGHITEFAVPAAPVGGSFAYLPKSAEQPNLRDLAIRLEQTVLRDYRSIHAARVNTRGCEIGLREVRRFLNVLEDTELEVVLGRAVALTVPLDVIYTYRVQVIEELRRNLAAEVGNDQRGFEPDNLTAEERELARRYKARSKALSLSKGNRNA